MLDRLRGRATAEGTGAYRLRLRVVTAETVNFERHPPGAMERWRKDAHGLPPPRETIPLTYAHLEPVDEHGHYAFVGTDGRELHAMGFLDVRAINPKLEETFKVGREFYLELDPVEGT